MHKKRHLKMLKHTRRNVKRKLFCKGLELNSFAYLWKNTVWIENVVKNKHLSVTPDDPMSGFHLVTRIQLPRWWLWVWRGHDPALVPVGLKKRKQKTKQKCTEGKYFMDSTTSGETNTALNNLSVVNIDRLNERENVLLYLKPSQLRIKDTL